MFFFFDNRFVIEIYPVTAYCDFGVTASLQGQDISGIIKLDDAIPVRIIQIIPKDNAPSLSSLASPGCLKKLCRKNIIAQDQTAG